MIDDDTPRRPVNPAGDRPQEESVHRSHDPLAKRRGGDRLRGDRRGAAAVAASLLLTGALAFATASSGASSSPVSAELLSRAALPDGLRIEADGASEIAVSKLRIKPAASTVWHSHAGTVVVSVKRGTAAVYRADGSRCAREQHEAGAAWVEPPRQVHVVRNEGSDTLVLYVVSTLPPASPLGSQETPPADCAFA
ncbi:MAG: cupin domain-containing protein [Solirubrobacteraceae bacterium]